MFTRSSAEIRSVRPGRRALGFALLASTSALLLAGTVAVQIRGSHANEAPHVTGLGDPLTLESSYAVWLENYAKYAGDGDDLVLGLHYVKGLSHEYTTAIGGLRVDLTDGTLDAFVRGLPQDERWQLWLVDNLGTEYVDGRGSVLPEPGFDDLRLVGALEENDDHLRLSTQLDLKELANFDLDVVVIAREGADLGLEGTLHGLPSFFQRVYHEQRTRGFGPHDDLPPVGAEPRVMHAAALPLASSPLPSTLIGLGEDLFFDEDFDGNGRTCGTCHPASNNFTLDPEFIETLEQDDPLFVAENVPALAQLENPELMRKLGLILENVDGFHRPGVMRGVPHIFALGISRTPAFNGFDGTTIPPMERLGWGGDGSPGGGTLREFAIGAVVQHATRRLDRVPGVDFRLPTDHELDAMEAFQLSVGRQSDPDLTQISLKHDVADRGRELFLTQTSNNGSEPAAKCTSCHNNGGANASPLFLASNAFPPGQFNLTLSIGTSELGGGMAEMVDPGNVPVDGGFGQDPHRKLGGFGTHAFNVPSLIEAPDTGPYFHDNSVMVLENVIEFYLGGEFNGSAAASLLENVDDPPGFGLLTTTVTENAAVGAFVRVMNALENCRSATLYMQRLKSGELNNDTLSRERVFDAALGDLEDAQFVLRGALLHPDAVVLFRRAWERLEDSEGNPGNALNQALSHTAHARSLLEN